MRSVILQCMFFTVRSLAKENDRVLTAMGITGAVAKTRVTRLCTVLDVIVNGTAHVLGPPSKQ